MYPNLYFLFEDLFGFSHPFLKLVNSFGFFVALAFIIGSYTLSLELKRKEEEGLMSAEKRRVVEGAPLPISEVIFSGFIGFIFGFKFIYLAMNASELFQGGALPQQHIFSLKGSWLWGIVLALVFAGYRYWQGKKASLEKPIEKTVDFHKYEYTGNITMVAAFSGIIGAKLFHLFENPKEFMQFFENPTLEGFIGGLTIYGGLLLGGLVTYLYARKKGIPGLHLLDSAAPGLMLAYGVGRIGCQVSGDGDWGIANANPKPEWMSFLPDWMWSYNYPNNVNAVRGFYPKGGYSGKLITENDPWPIFEGYGTYLDPGVYPTAFYETVMAIAIFILLWSLRKRIKTAGILFAIYLMFNGFERFWIEKIRVNSVYKIFGSEITQAEIISTLMFIAGMVMIVLLLKKKKAQVQQ